MRIAYSHSFLCRLWFRLQSYKWRKSQSLLGEWKRPTTQSLLFRFSSRWFCFCSRVSSHLEWKIYDIYVFLAMTSSGISCVFSVRCDMWCFECKLSCFINHLGRMNIIGIALYKVYFGLNWSKTLWCQYYWLNSKVDLTPMT